MTSINSSMCSSQDQFTKVLSNVESQFKVDQKDPLFLEKVSTFFKNNENFINTDSLVIMDSIAAKVRLIYPEDPVLIPQLKNYVMRMLPADEEGVKKFQALLKAKRSDYISSLANWINLMEIPLSKIDLREQEFYLLVRKLTYIDLRGLDLKKYDLKSFKVLEPSKRWRLMTSDPVVLFEIAKYCAQQHRSTAEFIQNFGIENKSHMFEIAKFCALKNPEETIKQIQNFGLEDKSQLLEIAKLCAQKNGILTIDNIKNFGIEDEKDLFEIVKVCAKYNGWSINQYIQNNGTKEAKQKFRIVDSMQWFEIAKLCATPESIQNFGIEDKNQLFEIAKICAQQTGMNEAENLKKFKIENRDELVEIAKIYIKHNTMAKIECIKDFGIDDEDKLYEIAKI